MLFPLRFTNRPTGHGHSVELVLRADDDDCTAALAGNDDEAMTIKRRGRSLEDATLKRTRTKYKRDCLYFGGYHGGGDVDVDGHTQTDRRTDFPMEQLLSGFEIVDKVKTDWLVIIVIRMCCGWIKQPHHMRICLNSSGGNEQKVPINGSGP